MDTPPIDLKNFENSTFDSYENLREILFELIKNTERRNGDKFAVIDKICSFKVDPENDTQPFQPRYKHLTERSSIPSDLTEEEIITCINLADNSPNNLIKARAADIVWHLKC